MPKKRQIPFLFPQALADGTTVWHWKPSPRLRKAGFVNVKLGSDERVAIGRAMDLNAQVAVWQGDAVAAIATGDVPVRRPIPRVVRFDELVRRYRASADFTDLRAATRRNYDTRLRQLTVWALDGQLAVRDIDKPLIRDLRTGLLKGSVWVCAATLRVLGLLLAWAVDEGIVPTNVASHIDIPQPPSRRVQMGEPARRAIAEAAIALDMPAIALGIDLGFWMLQRQADVLQLNRMAWRHMDTGDIGPNRWTAALVNGRGRVMGFRLQQQKTGTWIDAPLPPMLHDQVEATMRQSSGGWLFAHPDDPDKPMPGWAFQRRFRAAQEAAVDVAIMDGNMALAEAIDVCQFRDLRRTGMIYYRDSGASVPNITALSGHYVLGKKTIMDTYMPGDTAGACACVAHGLRAWRENQQQDLAL